MKRSNRLEKGVLSRLLPYQFFEGRRLIFRHNWYKSNKFYVSRVKNLIRRPGSPTVGPTNYLPSPFCSTGPFNRSGNYTFVLQMIIECIGLVSLIISSASLAKDKNLKKIRNSPVRVQNPTVRIYCHLFHMLFRIDMSGNAPHSQDRLALLWERCMSVAPEKLTSQRVLALSSH
jgi:hypothetical protein